MYLPPDTTDTVVVELAARIVPIYALYMLTSASMWAIRGNLNGNQNPLLLFPAILRRTAATVLGSIWRLLPSQASDGGVRDHIFLGTPVTCVDWPISTE